MEQQFINNLQNIDLTEQSQNKNLIANGINMVLNQFTKHLEALIEEQTILKEQLDFNFTANIQ